MCALHHCLTDRGMVNCASPRYEYQPGLGEMEMKITLQQTIIIGAMLFGAHAQAAGFASHDAAAAGRAATICSGVNGTPDADQPREKSCAPGGKTVNQPTLRGHYSD